MDGFLDMEVGQSESRIMGGHEETFGRDGCVPYLGYGDGFIGVYRRQNIRLYTLTYTVYVN